jgi:selenide, water dikinase
VKDLFVASDFPDLLAGLGDPDDAAVWKLDAERALVVTTDFFTPVVDDPFDFGRIAAANALSDIYAMGGRPFLALNVAALCPDLPVEANAEILRGGAEICQQAGVVVAGGHTVQDKEPKFGLVVLGFVHPERLLRKAGAQSGDLLVLTKPLGFGVTTTALKQGKADPKDVAEVVSWMVRLNRSAAALALEFGVQSATDVTGFGLLGHGLEMAEASNVAFHLEAQAIPIVSCAQKYADLWTFPGGASDNRLYYGPRIHFTSGITEEKQMLLFDPQTSGGLLMALSPTRKEAFFQRAKELGQPVWLIGEVQAGNGIKVG